MSDPKRVNCMKCRHYYVTWDPRFPRGCKAYGIKTRHMPSAAILATSGKPCLTFEAKDASERLEDRNR